MTEMALRSMGLDSHETRGRRRAQAERPRERLALFLRAQYRGAHAAKALARDIGARPKAAENAMAGHWPNDLHFAAIVRRFGRDVWQAVFEPEIAPVLARLKEEERRLDDELQAARARRRKIEGRLDSGADRVEAASDADEPDD